MNLIDLNRDGGIGANSLFLQLGDLRILVDCGLNPKLTGRRAAPDLSKLKGKSLDLILVTHCHLDHIGSLPLAMREHPDAPVLMTQSSRMLIERMLHNSASVMLRQKEEENIPDYPLFTHEEIDRLAKRFTPDRLWSGQAVPRRARKRSRSSFIRPATWSAPRRSSFTTSTAPSSSPATCSSRINARCRAQSSPPGTSTRSSWRPPAAQPSGRSTRVAPRSSDA
jgi:hypothetical protein